RARVLTTYAALEKTYRPLLAGHDPAILRMVNHSRGTSAFYQVRVGAESRTAAGRLCAGLHAAGAACVVRRNPAVM
ncbi:MAG: SPOR domain-containing protein, partial [Xanthobacteraceae bacterium]